MSKRNKKWRKWWKWNNRHISPSPFKTLRFKSTQVYMKMLYYTRAAKGEISGIGKVTFKEPHVIIDDVFIYKQTTSTASTHLDKETLGRVLFEWVKNGVDISQYALWWHTHNDFGVSWSSIDEGTIIDLSKDTRLVSICANKMGSMIARIDDRGKSSDLDVSIYGEDEKLRKKCEDEVNKKVTYEYIGYRYKDRNINYKYKNDNNRLLIEYQKNKDTGKEQLTKYKSHDGLFEYDREEGWMKYGDKYWIRRENGFYSAETDIEREKRIKHGGHPHRSWSDRKLYGDYINKDGNK